jgi:hypothetical protein
MAGQKAAWWAKLDRVEVPAVASGSGRAEAERLTRTRSHPEPTDTPDRVACRVHMRNQVPVAISTIVGDIVHNL